MKNKILIIAIVVTCMLSLTGFSQNNQEPESLGLPGDNLNLYAVLNVFQNSKTIEDFEKSINGEEAGINNLDLNNDGRIDFIKVVTEREQNNFTFVLQVALSKKDIQDVAVIFVAKDKKKNISIQIIGDEYLYGKDYIVEQINSTVTSNPGYSGGHTASTTVKIVEVAASPVVNYLYSPVYRPYYPRYYYGYYPSYFHPWAPIYFSAYYHNHYHYQNYYYRPPYYHYPPRYSHYSSGRNSSVVVINNTRNGYYRSTYKGNNYRKPINPTTRPTTRPTNPTTRPARPANPITRSTSPTTRPTNPAKRTTKPTTRPTRPTTPTARPSTTKSRSKNTGSSRNNATSEQSVQRNR